MTRQLTRPLLVLVLLALGWGQAAAQLGSVDLEWDPVDPNAAPDLAGYRIYWDTDPNIFLLTPAQALSMGATMAQVGPGQTTFTATGISSSVTYTFGVTSFDLSGNESPFSNRVDSAGIVVPTVRSLSPLSEAQGVSGVAITINGDNLLAGSTVDFGDPNDIAVVSVNDIGAPQSLVATVDIAPLARIGKYTVSVTNPGGSAGSKVNAFTVDLDVSRVDIDGSLRIDNGDLVLILLGFPSNKGDANYSTDIDLDLDGMVDGADLALFFLHFGTVF